MGAMFFSIFRDILKISKQIIGQFCNKPQQNWISIAKAKGAHPAGKPTAGELGGDGVDGVRWGCR